MTFCRSFWRVGRYVWHWPLSRHAPYPRGVQHGPKVWPFWRLVVVSVVRSTVHPPSSGWNVWIYTRWAAWVCGFSIDRRSL